jgi:hypothetical protein
VEVRKPEYETKYDAKLLLNQKNYILKGKKLTEKSIKYGKALSHKQGTTQERAQKGGRMARKAKRTKSRAEARVTGRRRTW